MRKTTVSLALARRSREFPAQLVAPCHLARFVGATARQPGSTRGRRVPGGHGDCSPRHHSVESSNTSELRHFTIAASIRPGKTMANESCGQKRSVRKRLYACVAMALLVSWPLATAAVWTEFAPARVGALATADVRRLVAIHGTTAATTSGYFQASAHPSALVGTRMRVIRTNSPWSETGLQLCAIRAAGGQSWCGDVTTATPANFQQQRSGGRPGRTRQ